MWLPSRVILFENTLSPKVSMMIGVTFKVSKVGRQKVLRYHSNMSFVLTYFLLHFYPYVVLLLSKTYIFCYFCTYDLLITILFWFSLKKLEILAILLVLNYITTRFFTMSSLIAINNNFFEKRNCLLMLKLGLQNENVACFLAACIFYQQNQRSGESEKAISCPLKSLVVQN